MDKPSRFVGYIRVSTLDQATTGLGLDAQRATIERTAAYRDWDLTAVFSDEGSSGRDLDRPELRRALQAVADGTVDGLVVSKLDRLTRSTADLLALLEWAENVGAVLVALDVDLDTSTPNGRLVAKVMASVVEWEREMIGVRTREAAAVRRSKGARMGRAGVRDADPKTARRIADLRGSGSSWQSIADELNADSIPTVRGGTMWRVSSVQSAAGYVRPPRRRRVPALPSPSRRR